MTLTDRVAGLVVLGLLLMCLLGALVVESQSTWIEWWSVPTGPHGTGATPTRYCATDFPVVNHYIIHGEKPDKFCVFLTGPTQREIFEPAFEVTHVYDFDGTPEITGGPEYGWACWQEHQLGIRTTDPPSWFVVYEIQVGSPKVDSSAQQLAEGHFGSVVVPYGGRWSIWEYEGCPRGVYLPTILKGRAR